MWVACKMAGGQNNYLNGDQDPDKRNRGRPPTRWTDDITKITKNWIRSAQDRREWTQLGEAYVQQWTQRAD